MLRIKATLSVCKPLNTVELNWKIRERERLYLDKPQTVAKATHIPFFFLQLRIISFSLCWFSIKFLSPPLLAAFGLWKSITFCYFSQSTAQYLLLRSVCACQSNARESIIQHTRLSSKWWEMFFTVALWNPPKVMLHNGTLQCFCQVNSKSWVKFLNDHVDATTFRGAVGPPGYLWTLPSLLCKHGWRLCGQTPRLKWHQACCRLWVERAPAELGEWGWINSFREREIYIYIRYTCRKTKHPFVRG